jgi:hypothetical protein
MDSLLKAAPSSNQSSGLSGLAGSLTGGMGDLASTAGSFQKLGCHQIWWGSLCRYLRISFKVKGAQTWRRCFLEP